MVNFKERIRAFAMRLCHLRLAGGELGEEVSKLTTKALKALIERKES